MMKERRDRERRNEEKGGTERLGRTSAMRALWYLIIKKRRVKFVRKKRFKANTTLTWAGASAWGQISKVKSQAEKKGKPK